MAVAGLARPCERRRAHAGDRDGAEGIGGQHQEPGGQHEGEGERRRAPGLHDVGDRQHDDGGDRGADNQQHPHRRRGREEGRHRRADQHAVEAEQALFQRRCVGIKQHGRRGGDDEADDGAGGNGRRAGGQRRPTGWPARNRTPVSGLSWKITWPAPRRLTSTKRRRRCSPPASPNRSHRPSDVPHPHRNRSGTAAPTTWRRTQIPDLPDRRHDRRRLVAQHLEDKSGVARQPAGAHRQPRLGVEAWRDRRQQRLQMRRRRQHDQVAEHVEVAHHAEPGDAVARRLDDEPLGEQRAAVRPRRADMRRKDVVGEGFAVGIVLASRRSAPRNRAASPRGRC